jgi:hypothetical protein
MTTTDSSKTVVHSIISSGLCTNSYNGARKEVKREMGVGAILISLEDTENKTGRMSFKEVDSSSVRKIRVTVMFRISEWQRKKET